MKRLLLLMLLGSYDLYCHRIPISFSVKQIHDPMVKVLNVDIPNFSSTEIPRGTYRMATNSGITDKYVTLVVDGRINRLVNDFVCFSYKNYDDTFDRVACINFKLSPINGIALDITF